MKTLTLLLFLAIGVTVKAQIKFNQDEDFKAIAFVDPTFDDAGFQIGLGIRKEMDWFWVGVETSTYQELNPAYYDIITQIGTILNWNKLDILLGARGGVVFRANEPFPLGGLIMMLEYNITKQIAIGGRLYVDHREDQGNEAYGDSDGYIEGIIFTNPESQENGAFVITFKIN